MDSSSAKLSRVEASEYLKRHHGIGHSAAYLAKLAVVGGGPKFSKANRAVIYAREHLDTPQKSHRPRCAQPPSCELYANRRRGWPDMLPATLSFDYGAVSAELAAGLRQKATAIRQSNKTFIEAILAAGADLLAARKELCHGKFGAWVNGECGFSLGTAENYMKAAQFAESQNRNAVTILPPATIYKLAAKWTPPEIVATVLSDAENGNVVAAKTLDYTLKMARHRCRVDKKKQTQNDRRSKRTIAKNEARRKAEAERLANHQERVRIVALGVIDTLGIDRVRFLLDALRPGDDFAVLEHLRRETEHHCERNVGDALVEDIPDFLRVSNRSKPFQSEAT